MQFHEEGAWQPCTWQCWCQTIRSCWVWLDRVWQSSTLRKCRPLGHFLAGTASRQVDDSWYVFSPRMKSSQDLPSMKCWDLTSRSKACSVHMRRHTLQPCLITKRPGHQQVSWTGKSFFPRTLSFQLGFLVRAHVKSRLQKDIHAVPPQAVWLGWKIC